MVSRPNLPGSGLIGAALLAIGLALGPAPVVAQSGGDEELRGPAPQGPTLRRRAPSREEAAQTEAKLLDSLMERLAKAKDQGSAKVLERAVWQVWLRSGSPTVDLLMKQVLEAMNKKRHTVALELLDAMVEIAPNYAEGWNKRATVYFLREQYALSLADIQRTLALEPRHFGALSGLAIIMRELGDDRAALEAYRRALRVHPHLEGAREAVDELSEEVEGRGI